MPKIYYILNPAHWTIPEMKTTNVSNHTVVEDQNNKWIWPDAADKRSINPQTFDELKTLFNITEIIILDRWTGKETCSVKDHVNRSGFIMLRGKTPYKTNPQFPDVSRIYSTVEGHGPVVVHTVGPENYLETDSNKVVSEMCGIVSPVWHYIGVKVNALCVPNNKTKDFISS